MAATILARAISRDGFESVSKEANPHELRKGAMQAVEAVLAELKRISKVYVLPLLLDTLPWLLHWYS